jgi:hypothetical protein
MELGMVMDKEERNFLKGHVQGQGQLSRSKTIKSYKQRTDQKISMKLGTVMDK